MAPKVLLDHFKRISEFLSPVNTWNPTKDSPATWLNEILTQKITSCFPDVKIDGDVRWIYVCQCLELLNSLQRILVDLSKEKVEGPLSADALSISQQQITSSLIQLIIVLGAVPSFLPGVGLPIEKRSKFSQVLKDEDVIVSPIEERHKRLVQVTLNLIKLTGHDGLKTVLLSRHVGDLLAALIQLGYAPLKKPNASCTEVNSDFVMTEDKYEKLAKEQEEFRKKLHDVISMIYPPMAVKYVLVLQSSGAKETVDPAPKSLNIPRGKTPKWIQKACGSLLTHRLVQKNGLIDVIKGILDIGQSDEHVDPKKYQIISSIISNPPSTGHYNDLENYFMLICPQILDILEMKDASDSKAFHLVAAACVRGMGERSSILSKRYLLGPIMDPLVRLTEKRLEAVENKVLSTEEEIDKCIEKLNILFVVSNDPSIMFVEYLRPIILPLLQLHCKICFGASHLRKPVEEIIKKFMKNSCGTLSMKAIRCFAFSVDRLEDGFKNVNMDLVFVNGEFGGMVAKVLNYSDNEEQQSFYVSDDEKSIAIVDLLEYSKFRSMTIDFFLSLLKDLTEMMNDEGDAPVPIMTGEPQGTNEGVNELLRMEDELERTMKKIRKRLMIIRLISLMSEDDELQEAMMNNSAQKIKFLLSTLNRAVVMSKARAKEKTKPVSEMIEEIGDQKAENTELQSLSTAVSLLRHHVTQKNVKVSDWKLLQAGLDDLKYLSENYEDESIAKISGRMRELIATHGAVLEHNDKMKNGAKNIEEMTKQMNDKIDDLKKVSEEFEKAKEKIAAKDKEGYNVTAALEDVDDKEIPIKGHGLIVLTRLVEEKDQETLKNIDKIIEVFKENLEHRDTYVYLQAVKGLAATSNYDPEGAIEVLTGQYVEIEDNKLPKDDVMEARTKLGEAIVQVTKVLGEITPAYKNKLLNPFLGQLNHPDNLVRASSLSNIGEICKNLRFELGNIVFEIFMTLDNILKFDKSIEVRRAAVLVMVLILEGLGRDTLVVLKSAIRDIWRTLKKLRNTETDEVLIHHVAKAIEHIDKIVKDFFQPDTALQKTIYVLDEPPQPF